MSTPTLPTTSVALRITERKQQTPLTLARIAIPELGEHELLIENIAVAQAQGDVYAVDADSRFLIPTIPYTNGWDCSGVVLGVGSEVKNVQVGDRVASFALANPASKGSYQQYTIGVDHITCKIPSNLTHEIATTIPLAFSTALSGLFSLGLLGSSISSPIPHSESGSTVLVWGGASSVGAMAVQIAKLSGYKVVATASEKSWEYVKSLGADFVVDYKEGEKAVEEIRRVTQGELGLVYDSISYPGSIPLAIKCFGSKGGKMVVDRPGSEKADTGGRTDVEIVYAGAYSLVQDPNLKKAFELLEALLSENKLVYHPMEVLPGGLLGVNVGWRRQRNGEVGSQKLVYRIAETEGLADV
ncbi:hypothetical protein P7C70_g8888, partial [Phenoliferia sp. Uapishka_3]